MRFLNVGTICGIPNSIRDEERRLGYISDTISFDPDDNHKSDFEYNIPYSLGRIQSSVKRFLILLKVSKEYDVIHFAGNSIMNGLDIPVWKILGKKVVIHYHGSEIRNKPQPFFHKFADALFASTPDLLQFGHGAIWLPNPIDITKYNCSIYNRDFIITHAPSDPLLKGTEDVVKVMKSYPDIKFDLITGIPYEEALYHYRKATIVIDQLKIGWYGMVALECMVIGTPVMCYISPELKKYLKEPYPLFITSKETLKDDIIKIQDKSVHETYIKNGREYVSTIHNVKNIVQTIIGELQ